MRILARAGGRLVLPERALGQRATALGARAASLDALGVFLRSCGGGNITHERADRQPSEASRPGRRARKKTKPRQVNFVEILGKS